MCVQYSFSYTVYWMIRVQNLDFIEKSIENISIPINGKWSEWSMIYK